MIVFSTQAHGYDLDSDGTSEELLKHWFGPDAQSEWFPYASKSVSTTFPYMSTYC